MLRFVTTLFVFFTVAFLFAVASSSSVVMSSTTTSSSAPIYITNKASLFDTLSKTLIPEITSFATKNLTIPGNTITVPGISSASLTYSSFKLSELGILDVLFSNSAPNNLDMTVIDLSLTVPKVNFTLHDKLPIGHISCDGQFWASTSGANSKISLPFIKNQTAGDILDIGNITNYTVGAGNLVVDHSVNGLLCKLGQDILQVFIKNLNTDIENKVKAMIGPLLIGTTKTLMEEIFSKIPLKLASSPYVDVSIDAMTLPFDALGFLKEQKNREKQNEEKSHLQQSSSSSLLSQLRRTQLAKKKEMVKNPQHVVHLLDGDSSPSQTSSFTPPNVDISIDVPQDSINSILTYLTAQGYFNLRVMNASKNLTTAWLRPYMPIAYSVCPNCYLQLDIVNSIAGNCTATTTVETCSAPTVALSHDPATNKSAINFFLHGTALKVSAVNPQQENKTMELFSLAFNGEGGLSNITFKIINLIVEQLPVLEFNLAKLQNVTCFVKSSNIGPITDPGVMAWMVEDIFNKILIPLIDELITFKIPFPTKISDTIYLTSPLAQVNDGNLLFGFDITML